MAHLHQQRVQRLQDLQTQVTQQQRILHLQQMQVQQQMQELEQGCFLQLQQQPPAHAIPPHRQASTQDAPPLQQASPGMPRRVLQPQREHPTQQVPGRQQHLRHQAEMPPQQHMSEQQAWRQGQTRSLTQANIGLQSSFHLPATQSSLSQAASPVGAICRAVCHCSTVILFPGNVTSRTCWRCGATLSRPTIMARSVSPPPSSRVGSSDRADQDSEMAAHHPVCSGVRAPSTGAQMHRTARPARLRSLTPSPAPSDSSSGGSVPVAPRPPAGLRSSFRLDTHEAAMRSRIQAMAPFCWAGSAPQSSAFARQSPRQAQVPRPKDLPEEPADPDLPRRSDVDCHQGHAIPAVISGWRWADLCLAFLLASSLLVNIHLLVNSRLALLGSGARQQEPVGNSNRQHQDATLRQAAGSAFADTDGDGIPDQHDFCPSRCTSADGSHCSLAWISGKATDFDGDGCQDGVEDHDRDDDGVRDVDDKCPETPMRWGFVSNQLNDFDGDGCADGLEDSDNDEDGTKNVHDRCPRTPLSHGSDGSGCSDGQKAPGATREKDHKWWEALPGSASTCARPATVLNSAEADGESSVYSWWIDWADELKGAWAEVLVGAILTATLTRLNRVATNLQQQLPATPTGHISRRVSAMLVPGST